jgi:SNF2-related domain
MILVVPLVAPLALLEQWKREIETFVEPDVFEILIYHGPGRTKNKSTIQKMDVVLTTYQVRCYPCSIRLSFTLLQTLALEWPDELKEEKKAKQRALKKALGQGGSDERSEDEGGHRPKYGPLMEVT